jgi:hypothetical protein
MLCSKRERLAMDSIIESHDIGQLGGVAVGGYRWQVTAIALAPHGN